MYLILIYFLILLIFLNVFIWIYDERRSKNSILRSKKAFKIAIIITILSYIVLLIWGFIQYQIDKHK
jgi:quinol-cytochrome oxidoreductase complex cytochrome b subunit